MSLDLVNFEKKVKRAVKDFWANRDSAKQKQMESGKADQGERAGVTAGKNMNGFVELFRDVIVANGLSEECVCLKKAVLTLPGFFRPTKLWDMLVLHRGHLVAAIELKSQIGPSFGNNFNNRTEEAIGNAHDLWIAYREGAFGKHPRPFVGWFMLVEDAPGARSPINDRSPHFAIFSEFEGASYLKRYDLLCQKLIQEQLYTSASLITASRSSNENGRYGELSELTGVRCFVSSLAGHIASEVARCR